MLNYLKNQRGSTLAIVVIIIVLFSILGLGLVTLNASASKQFTNKEQQVQARHFAEMGLVHYKSEAVDTLVEHNSVLNDFNTNDSLTEEQKVNLLNGENDKLCIKLKDPTKILNPINATDPQHYNISILDCDFNFDKTEVNVSIRSEGKSLQGKLKTIDLDLLIELPGTLTVGTGHSGDGSKTPPAVPISPESIPNKSWAPCNKKGCLTTEVNFTDVSDIPTVKSKKGNMLFKNSLIMNNFRIDGGNGLQMTVNKDLYLKGELDVQNHACIVVQGDFTASSQIIAGAKFYLFVYGDANLPNTIKLHNNHGEIFVSGDVYIDGVKKEPKSYSPVPTSFGNDCSPLPGAPKPKPKPKPKPNNPIDLGLGAQLINTDYKY